MQGYPGCFHQEAAGLYFDEKYIEFIPALTFKKLADKLNKDHTIDFGIMAIENNIAGSILQNYRILREQHFRIVGEIYLPIHHNLMALPNQKIENIREVHSHPMAINQCLQFLQSYPHIKIVESKDTALSALLISQEVKRGIASISSAAAADLYQLEILERNIETSQNNETRFFIIQRSEQAIPVGVFDKASIYLRVSNTKGSLLKALQIIYENNVDLSKLQSYPISGCRDSYFFHLDLEFSSNADYEKTILLLQKTTLELQVLGVYKSFNKM